MADDGKRTENVCAKVTERMALDLLREASKQGVSVSNYLYRLLRLNLYGVTLGLIDDEANLQSKRISDEG